jgi:hypothetical protein
MQRFSPGLALSVIHSGMVALALSGFAAPVQAQTQNSYPMLMSIKPVAVQAGQTVEVELTARYNLLGASRVLVTGEGLIGDIVPPEKPPEIKPGMPKPVVPKAKLRFTAAADAVPGVRDFRVATPQGASTIGQIVIVRDPVVAEAAENNTLDKAEAIAFPATYCGTIEKAEDVDCFKFKLDAPATVVFHVWAQRLENRIHDLQAHLDPIITLRTATGNTLATADNVFAGDPLLVHTFDAPGEYVLDIRDVRYQGNVDWVYAIEMSARPFVTHYYPASVAPGVEASVTALGKNIPMDATVKLTLPADVRREPLLVSPALAGQATNSALIVPTTAPVVLEAEGDNNSPMTAAALAIPSALNGKIDAPMDVDLFVFEAKKGDRFTFDVLCRRIGSPMDPIVRIVTDKSSPYIENDDYYLRRQTIRDSRIEGWVAPADGKFFLEVRDLHSAGSGAHSYLVLAEKAEPYFELEMDLDKSLLAPGISSPLFVRVLRKNGFAGPVDLKVENLPPGVTATCGKILADGTDGLIVFKADANAPVGVGNIKVLGTGSQPVMGGEPIALRAEAYSMQEIYMPGGGRHHHPVDMPHTVSVADPMDVRSIKLSQTAVTLKPGESQKIEVEIVRADDYKGNVTLDCIFQHLEQPHAVSLPKGVKVDSAKSKTLLTAGETKGSIVLVAAADAPPVENQLVPIMVHVSINFVMKHAFCGDPLTITVQPK